MRHAHLLQQRSGARADGLRQGEEGGEVGRMVDVHGDARLVDHRRFDVAAPRRVEVRVSTLR